MKKFRNFLMVALAVGMLTVVGFASEPAASFDLVTIMSTSATKIVGDLMQMIAAVLPITVTLLGASVGIAYGIRFIKSITKKAG